MIKFETNKKCFYVKLRIEKKSEKKKCSIETLYNELVFT